MTKWNTVKIPFEINGKETKVLMWHRGKKCLTSLFAALSEKREPPYNLTELCGVIRRHHPIFSRAYFRDDLEQLKLLGVLELRGCWRELLIIPTFKEVVLKPYEDTVKVEIKK